MSEKIEGKLIVIGETQTFPSGFQKKQIVVETQTEKYSQTIPIEFLKDNIEKLDGLQVGDMVSVAYDLRGNEHNGRYYASIIGWNVRSTDESRRGAPQSSQEDKSPSQVGNESSEGDAGFDGDEIPF